VFILVAINAKVFPVGAVRGIVPGISVFVMDSQQMPAFVSELPGALGAYESVNLKGLLPVAALIIRKSAFRLIHKTCIGNRGVSNRGIFPVFRLGCIAKKIFHFP